MDADQIQVFIQLIKEAREAQGLPEPVRLQIIQEGALAELFCDGSAPAVQSLGETTRSHALPQIASLAWTFVQILAERNNLDAQEEICRLYIHHDHTEAGMLALEKGYLPREVDQRALFYLLTGQANRLADVDPDFMAITTAYREADSALRKRAIDAARKIGYDEWESAIRATVNDEPQAWQALLNRLPIFQREPVRSLALHLLDELAGQGHPQALDTIFRLFLDLDYAPARDLALGKGYLPSDSVQRALFFFLSGQWDRYEQLDFNQSLLATAYETASPSVRRRLIAATRRSGRLDWLQSFSAGRKVRWLGDMTDADWQAVQQTLLREGKYAELWRLAQAAPPLWSIKMLLQLKADHWTPTDPKESDGFTRLISLAEQCKGQGVDLHKPKVLKGVFRNLNCLALSPDGKRLACGTAEGSIQLWQLPDLEPHQVIPTPAGQVWSLGFSPNGEFLAAGYGDHTVRIWRSEDGRLVKTLEGHQGTVRCLSVSPDGRQLASGGFDGTVKVWRFPYGPELRTQNEGASEIFSLQFSPDGRFLGSGSSDQNVRIWSTETGKSIREWKAHTSTVSALAFNQDTSLLASGSRDHSINLWALPDASLMKTIPEHHSMIAHLSIQPGGRILASASMEGQVGLWSLPDGQRIHLFQAHPDAVAGLAFFPDGERLVTAGSGGKIQIWDLKPLLSIRLPVEKVSSADIQRIQGILQEEPLTASDRCWFEFSLALIQWRHRYDIGLVEHQHLQVGEYDIELG